MELFAGVAPAGDRQVLDGQRYARLEPRVHVTFRGCSMAIRGERTHPVYWGIGGVLVGYGLMRSTPGAKLAIGAGALLLILKIAELGSRVARVQ